MQLDGVRSAADTFNGTVADRGNSTIAWNYRTNLSSSAPTYTAAAVIRDTGGASLSSSTCNRASAKQF